VLQDITSKNIIFFIAAVVGTANPTHLVTFYCDNVLQAG
jgi:hypothetical protein